MKGTAVQGEKRIKFSELQSHSLVTYQVSIGNMRVVFFSA
ncbi:hypothetical protein B4123_3199 [Bacillus paralicheniformis]|nr:hypothetical protein B4123_3199 [Bacillus paralicheniformis]